MLVHCFQTRLSRKLFIKKWIFILFFLIHFYSIHTVVDSGLDIKSFSLTIHFSLIWRLKCQISFFRYHNAKFGWEGISWLDNLAFSALFPPQILLFMCFSNTYSQFVHGKLQFNWAFHTIISQVSSNKNIQFKSNHEINDEFT